VPLLPFTASGDLPAGIHRATLRETLDRFGTGSPKRKVRALRLERIYRLASKTGHLARLVVFGSFVTAKPEPNDAAILNLDLASISKLNLELFNHKGHQLGPTLKEDILGQGGEIMEERLSG
jgi:hypothetical protein